RRLVELPVMGDLGDEVRQPAVVRHGRHAEEDLPRVVILRDRLERLEILKPGREHQYWNACAPGAVTARFRDRPPPPRCRSNESLRLCKSETESLITGVCWSLSGWSR